MIYGWVIWLLILAVDLYTDIHRLKVNHIRGGLLRCIGLVPVLWLVPWWQWPLMLTGYMVLFNGLWNALKRLPWFRIGETAWSDRMMRRWPWLLKALYGLFVGSAILFILKIFHYV